MFATGKDQIGEFNSKLCQEAMGDSRPGSAQIAAGIVGEDGSVPEPSSAILMVKAEILGDGTATIAAGAQKAGRAVSIRSLKE